MTVSRYKNQKEGLLSEMQSTSRIYSNLKDIANVFAKHFLSVYAKNDKPIVMAALWTFFPITENIIIIVRRTVKLQSKNL